MASYTITRCRSCQHGQRITVAGRTVGHIQPSSLRIRDGHGVEISGYCPGYGRRAYGARIVRQFRSAARAAAVRSILRTV